MINCFINGVEYSIGTDHKIVKDITYKTKTDITVYPAASAAVPADKDRVEIFKDGTRIFFGKIQRAVSPELSTFKEVNRFKCSCLSAKSILADRTVTAVFENTTLDIVVRYFFDNFLIPEELIDFEDISDFSAIPVEDIRFNREFVEAAMDQIAEIAGAYWGIDPKHKTGYFKFIGEFDSIETTFDSSADNANLKFSKLKHVINAIDVRNSHTVAGGTAPTDLQTERFQGDGVAQTFVVGYPLRQKPNLYLGEPPVQIPSSEIGVRGIDDNNPAVNWFFSYRSTEISQRTTETPISDILTAGYIGEFPVSVNVKNSERVTERKARVGGTGIVEGVSEGQSFTDYGSATALAEEQLTRFLDSTETLTFWIHEDQFLNHPSLSFEDFDAGVFINFDLPERNIEGQFLITEVSIQDHGLKAGTNERSSKAYIVAHKGDVSRGYGSIFANLSGQLKGLVVNENEVVTIAEISEAALTLQEEILIFIDNHVFLQNTSPIIENAYGMNQDINSVYLRG